MLNFVHVSLDNGSVPVIRSHRDLAVPGRLCERGTRRWRCDVRPKAIFLFCVLLSLGPCSVPMIAQAARPAGPVWLQNDLKSALPGGAQPQGGKWQVREGHLEQSAYGGPALLVMGEPDWNDYTARVRVRFAAPAKGTEAGLALHVRGPGDYVVFSLKNKKGGLFAVLRIESSAGIGFNVNAPYLGSVRRTTMVGDQNRLAADPGIWHELRVDAHGTQFYGYVDGQHVVDYDFSTQQPSWYVHKPMWTVDPTQGRLGLFSAGWPAEFRQLEVRRLSDFSHIVTPQSGRRDAAGRLLPRQSYAETMRRFTEWVLHSNEVVEKDMAPPSLQHLEPILLAIWVLSDDEGVNYDVGEFAFNAALFISGAVQYYLYTGDTRTLGQAKLLADWGIANSTPAEWTASFLAPSIVQWLPDGRWQQISTYEKWGLEPDKSAYLADAYLRLYLVTEEAKYLAAVRRIADTLVKLRQPDGSWPFRVDPRTGRVNDAYTHSQLWYIRFFERLARVTGEKNWLKYHDEALRWMLENPVKTNRWQGLYGDNPPLGETGGKRSYDQWVPLEFAQYLLDHRAENPQYLDIARKIVDWVTKTHVVMPGLHAGVPGLVEQTGYEIVIAHHELRLAQTHALLWGATGDPKHKQTAQDVANSVTWLLMSDGKLRMGFWYHASASYMRCLVFNDQFTRIMAEIPETASQGEDHFLHTTSDLRRILYGERTIQYETVGPGTETFVLRSAPRQVKAGGVALPEAKSAGQMGWDYDPQTHRLRIRHEQADVEILL